MRERIEGKHTEMLFKAPQGREIDFGRQLTSLANCAAVLCVSLHVCARAPVCVCVCVLMYTLHAMHKEGLIRRLSVTNML